MIKDHKRTREGEEKIKKSAAATRGKTRGTSAKRGVIFHSQIVPVSAEQVAVKSFGKEVSNVQVGGDMANSNLQLFDVVADLEITNVQVARAL